MENINTPFFSRLEQLKNFLKIKTERSFCKKIGISYGNYNSYKKGTQPSLHILINILTNIEDLNPSWLLLGEEPMFLKNDEISVVTDVNAKYIPLSREDRLLEVIESQQRVIRSQQYLIELETYKNYSCPACATCTLDCKIKTIV